MSFRENIFECFRDAIIVVICFIRIMIEIIVRFIIAVLLFLSYLVLIVIYDLLILPLAFLIGLIIDKKPIIYPEILKKLFYLTDKIFSV